MEETFNYDFRTPLQKERDQRRKDVIAMFKDCRAKADERTSDTRIMTVIAQHVGCTAQNVRAILTKYDIIKPKRG